MKIEIKLLLLLIPVYLLLTSCGTIVGGRMYKAVITTPQHPNATIEYNGRVIGKGVAKIRIPRNMANRVVFTVKEESCETQRFFFTGRRFRGWSLIGSIVTFTPTPNGVILPIGVAIDLLTGALWKPDISEPGLIKKNYKYYEYQLSYNGCKTPEPQIVQKSEKVQKLEELKDLLDKKILTQEEFDNEKAKILEEKK